MTHQRVSVVLRALEQARRYDIPGCETAMIRYALEYGKRSKVTAKECQRVLNMSVKDAFLWSYPDKEIEKTS